MSEKITAMIEEIKGLTVLELSELVHALEDTFGVSAAAVAAAAPLQKTRGGRLMKRLFLQIFAWLAILLGVGLMLQPTVSQYLAAHLHENLTSETICRALSVSRTGLYYLSRQSYGCGINEQITHLRIQKAMKLLCDTSLSNAQICQQIGFPDDNYFYRVFRRQTGLTPRQYRDSIIADNAKPE